MKTSFKGKEESKEKNQKKSSDRSGRDATLSEYLSSLSEAPLLDKEREQELAAKFRSAELTYWAMVLENRHTLAYIASHPMMESFSESKAIQELLRAMKRHKDNSEAKKRRSSIREKKIEKIADALRSMDEDRRLIDELLVYLEHTKIEPAPGENAQERRERVIRLEVAHRTIRENLIGHRQKALLLRNQFVRSNLRLVVSIARRFHHYRLPLIDLIQEGNIGLIKSVHRFDHRKGFRFSTYAHWWIRQAIERAIMNKGTQIRLPVHIFDARREVAKASRELSQKLGREPTVHELSAAIGSTAEKVQEVLDAVPREPASIDERIGDAEDRCLGETLQDHDQIQPDESVIGVDQAEQIHGMLATLNPMEIDIIKRRFGLVRYADETLEQIGKSYNLSRERVRQIQVQGLRKMYVQCRQRSIAI